MNVWLVTDTQDTYTLISRDGRVVEATGKMWRWKGKLVVDALRWAEHHGMTVKHENR